ncbi:MAG: ABC transporter ATP-binding protein [Acidimicrobiaceae bacterium]|nr:ABC transporter ATP-binding protein [Acidimicrobiaceae bacterium]
MSDALLEARHLSRHFVVHTGHGLIRPKKIVRAVDDVSLSLNAGRVTAIVGESGSGKSVLARMLARIVTPTSGELLLSGVALPVKSPRNLAYASEVQLVLQDPFASINPVHKVRHSLERPLLIHGTPRSELESRSRAALTRVSLDPPERYLDRYPHELSGGQLQRVSIARALCVNPQVLLADEPISMLDVSVRLGVLNLLRGLCDDEKLAVLYITHDIASARYIADETIVMYAGQVVEHSDATALIDGPTHPYTQLLIASVPDPSDPLRQAPEIEDRAGQGQLPAQGCRFAPRCPHAMDVCRTSPPPLFEVAVGHESRCWLHESAAKVSIQGREKGGMASTT